jgi:hypothetical protein
VSGCDERIARRGMETKTSDTNMIEVTAWRYPIIPVLEVVFTGTYRQGKGIAVNSSWHMTVLEYNRRVTRSARERGEFPYSRDPARSTMRYAM